MPITKQEIDYVREEISRRRSARRETAQRRDDVQGRKMLYPEGPHALITQGGAVFKLQAAEQAYSPQGGGIRGKIEHLSADSRRRLMRLLASIDLTLAGGYPLFITLTYPGDYPNETKQFKRDLDVFLKRLARESPKAAGAWRLEPQARGAPHYHLLVYNIRFLHYEWVASNWFEVVGSGCSDHLLAGTKVEAIRSYNGVLSYAAKYMSKRPEGTAPLDWGRWWGIFNRKGLHITTNDIPLTDEQFTTLQRCQTRLLAHRGCKMRATLRRTSSTVFIASPEATKLVLYVCNGTLLGEATGWAHIEQVATSPRQFAPAEAAPVDTDKETPYARKMRTDRLLGIQEHSRQLWKHYPRPRGKQQTFELLINYDETRGKDAPA